MLGNRTASLNKRKLIIAILLSTLILALIMYIFAWRPSDKSYDDALSNITTLKSSYSSAVSAIDTIQKNGDFTNATVTTVTKAFDNYNAAATSLDSSVVVTRDSKVANAYSNAKKEIDVQKKSFSELSDSLKIFGTLMTSCNKLWSELGTISKLSDFEKTSQACSDSIDAVRSAPSNTVTRDVSLPYALGFSSFLDTNKKYFTASDSNNTEAKKKALAAMDQAGEATVSAANKDFDYTFQLSSGFSNSIESLHSTLINQKDSLLR